MKIFISYSSNDRQFYSLLEEALARNGFRVYPKHLRGFFGAQGLHDPDELDEFFRDEDLAIVAVSENYLKDRWLPGELHALLTLGTKLRPRFVLPVFFGDIDDSSIPEECFVRPAIDFRGRDLEKALGQLICLVKEYDDRPRSSVFISHSSKDAKVAEALGDLLKFAFGLTAEEILCTSVGGYRLSLSSPISETLRRKIREARVFVCVATENSIGTSESPGSFYVAIELGARWGMKRYLAVLLAAGATGGFLKPPFSELNVLSCDDHGQIQQFIREVAPILGRDPEPADKYARAISRLVEASKEAAAERGPNPSAAPDANRAPRSRRR